MHACRRGTKTASGIAAASLRCRLKSSTKVDFATVNASTRPASISPMGRPINSAVVRPFIVDKVPRVTDRSPAGGRVLVTPPRRCCRHPQAQRLLTRAVGDGRRWKRVPVETGIGLSGPKSPTSVTGAGTDDSPCRNREPSTPMKRKRRELVVYRGAVVNGDLAGFRRQRFLGSTYCLTTNSAPLSATGSLCCVCVVRVDRRVTYNDAS